eukprot:4690571-Prymnesium_polylepis.1
MPSGQLFQLSRDDNGCAVGSHIRAVRAPLRVGLAASCLSFAAQALPSLHALPVGCRPRAERCSLAAFAGVCPTCHRSTWARQRPSRRLTPRGRWCPRNVWRG